MHASWLRKIGRSALLSCALLIFLPPKVSAGPHPKDSVSFINLHIPHLSKRPTVEEFESMAPGSPVAKEMLKVSGFTQRDPKDGAPISQKTEVYLGYTNDNLYVVCLCFDAQPNKIRTHMVRRELINDDDQFGFVLDTFHDRKNGVFFYANPYGVQQDGIWNDFQEPDYSYDMLWNSQGRVNSQTIHARIFCPLHWPIQFQPRQSSIYVAADHEEFQRRLALYLSSPPGHRDLLRIQQ